MIGPQMNGPPMPGFCPPPLMPDFSEMLGNKPKKTYSSAPVIKRSPQINKKKDDTAKSDEKDSAKTAKITPDSDEKDNKAETKKKSVKGQVDVNIGPHVPAAAPPVVTPQFNAIPPQMGGMPPNQMQAPPQFNPNPMFAGMIPTQVASQNKAAAAAAAKDKKKKKHIRTAAGTKWEDQTLDEWDPNDYRIFCGDLGNEVTDDTLTRVFTKYPSFQKARVIRDKNSNKTKGYGFVSFRDPSDFIKAMREMNGKYVGNRPIKLRKSNWRDRSLDVVRKKNKEKKKLGYKV